MSGTTALLEGMLKDSEVVSSFYVSNNLRRYEVYGGLFVIHEKT